MKRPKNLTLLLVLGITVLLMIETEAIQLFGRGEPGDDGDGDSDETIEVFWLDPFQLGRHPPRRPPFFLGAFKSDPVKDWQINMYKTLQCLGLSPELVDEKIQTNISREGNNLFRFAENIGNTTAWNFTFQLGVRNSTQYQGNDVDILVDVKGRDKLVISYNSTATGVVKIFMDFEEERKREYNAVFFCNITTPNVEEPQTVRGMRHFSKMRRND